MSNDKINGVPTDMRAVAREIDEASSHARMGILRVHAHLEGMPQEGTWNDRNQRDILQRYADVRTRLESSCDELMHLALEVRGLADRYEEALG